MNKKAIAAAIAVPALLGIGFYLIAATSFTPSAQPVGYVGQPSITSRLIGDGLQTAFRPEYERTTWTGNLLAVPVGPDGTADNGNADWNLAVRVNLQNWNTGRKIFSRDASAGVPFRRATPGLSATQLAAMGGTTAAQDKIINYVRGSNADEVVYDTDNVTIISGTLRRRDTSPINATPVVRNVIGAVIHSSPNYFYDGTNANVYVGANDGMLHAVNAVNGDEVWAYVPGFLIANTAGGPGINALTVNPIFPATYPINYYVDGDQTIARGIDFSGTPKNILVGTVGAGGKGLYALNITAQRPANETAAAAMSLWEITSASTGFGNLGYTYSRPRIAVTNDGTDVVVIGNGYRSTNGLATLLIINAKTGALLREISTGAGTAGSPNGLSTPSVIDVDGDGEIDYAYAGDLDGNLWKFDLTSSSPGSWNIKGGIAGTTSNVALYTTSPVQSITVAPAIGPHPNGGRMITFATGRMLMAADETDTATHYAYGIWDGAPSTNTALLAQTLTANTYVNGATNIRVRTATDNVPDWTAYVSGATQHHRGWRTPMPVTGEKVVGPGTYIEGGRFVFTSTNPTLTVNIPVGETWLNQLNFLTGGTSPSPIFNLNGDTVVDSADRILVSGVRDLTPTGLPVSKFLRRGLSSQPLLVSEDNLDDTLFTFNGNGGPPAVTDPGVSGGHFDVDIFYGSGDTLYYDNTGGTIGRPGSEINHKPSAVRHYHQYDDRYDVTGVNYLNASSANLNLANVPAAVMTNSTQFKVLVYNQYYSPAIKITVGGAAALPVRNYAGLTAGSLNLATLTNYTRTTVNSLEVEMPLTAFAVKDWTNAADPNNDSDVRTGVLPTAYDCVVWDRKGGSASWPILQGAGHNGALTVQLIRTTTPASAIIMNVSGHPEMGYRVRDGDGADALSVDDRVDYILVEYSIYWHMPNSGFAPAPYVDSKSCSQDADWTDAPPQETGSSSGSATAAVGSDDPKLGAFSSGLSVVSDVVTGSGYDTVRTTTYTDGSKRVITTVDNDDGTMTVTTQQFDAAGNVTSTDVVTIATPGSVIGEGGEQVNSPYGRLSWRDF